MPMCGGLLEPRGLGLRLLESTFSAENFICSTASVSRGAHINTGLVLCRPGSQVDQVDSSRLRPSKSGQVGL